MSTAIEVTHSLQARESPGVRLHRFTMNEFDRMAEFGVFHEDDPIELIDGQLFIKLENGPPYGVPLGIPPETIAGVVDPFPQRKFTVAEYEKLMDSGALPPALRTELVEGWVVDKMVRNPRHDSAIQRAEEAIQQRLRGNWTVRGQSALVLDETEPEPDVTVVRGPVGRYDDEHPRPHEVMLLIEISDSTLAFDRKQKLRSYARNGIVRYWIINLIDRIVEVYEDPTGATDMPEFRSRRDYHSGDQLPLIIGDEAFDSIPVEELLPAKK